MGNSTSVNGNSSGGVGGSSSFSSSVSLEPLNQKDVELIKSTWTDVNKDEIGICIMIR